MTVACQIIDGKPQSICGFRATHPEGSFTRDINLYVRLRRPRVLNERGVFLCE
jgi:hypothetical protein